LWWCRFGSLQANWQAIEEIIGHALRGIKLNGFSFIAATHFRVIFLWLHFEMFQNREMNENIHRGKMKLKRNFHFWCVFNCFNFTQKNGNKMEIKRSQFSERNSTVSFLLKT
jgi:hypothetical protein